MVNLYTPIQLFKTMIHKGWRGELFCGENWFVVEEG